MGSRPAAPRHAAVRPIPLRDEARYGQRRDDEARPLEQLGYEHRPWVFAADDDHLFFVKDTAGKRSHHLHLFGVASPAPAENRIFRAYLLANPHAARRYEAAKKQAAERHPDSRARYGAAKEEVMMQVLAEARLWGRSRAVGGEPRA
jgi:GrpB-like predicted nucleotidyltransferase (UPF0157 family)